MTIKKDMLDLVKTEFSNDYDNAGMESDGETGVHNEYEQGKEDALNYITTLIKKIK